MLTTVSLYYMDCHRFLYTPFSSCHILMLQAPPREIAQVRNEYIVSTYTLDQLIRSVIATLSLSERKNEIHLTLVGASDGLAAGGAASVDGAGLADVND